MKITAIPLRCVRIICVSVFLGAASLALAAQAVEDRLAGDVGKLLKKDQEYLVLDVRTPAEFEEGHLPGAVNIDFFGPRFENELGKLDHGKPVIVYCRSGKRSAGAATMLKDAGFDKVINMDDGLLGWEKAGLPIEKDKKDGKPALGKTGSD